MGQLLRHTSGFGDFFSIPELRSKSDFAWEREYEPAELLPHLFKVPIPSQPGEKWSYSNIGYYLLGWIIEKVTGEPYATFLNHRIFEPLQMMETRRMSRRDIIPDRASGYTWENKVLRNAKFTSLTWAYSEGGLVSSVSDLAKADAGLFGEKLLKRTTLERMWQPSHLSDGTLTNYGIGWNIGSDPQRRQIYHSGNKPGFASIIRHYIDDSLTVVLLANVDNGIEVDGDVGAISYHVAASFSAHGKAPLSVTHICLGHKLSSHADLSKRRSPRYACYIAVVGALREASPLPAERFLLLPRVCFCTGRI